MSHRVARIAALAAVAAVAAAVPASADDVAESKGLRKAITPQAITEHLQALHDIAMLNGGNRVGGSPGYEASADYVTSRLEDAGYTVSDHEFNFVYNADITPAVLQEVSPEAQTFVDGVDFSSMTFSPNGDDTAAVWAVDIVFHSGADNGNTSGCESGDFAGMPTGSIALMQRGTCPFGTKAANAAAAGAAAAIIFNEGNNAGRTGVINGTLGAPAAHSAQAVGTTFAVGQDLSNGVVNGDTGSVARVRVDRINEERTTRNLIAERPGTTGSDVVVVGAHLDSVPRGPGVNDNGSGSGSILELAEQMAARGITPRNTVRFMWYGAEEFGLLGSNAYVNSLSSAELARVKAMLNFDMVASPNFVRFVYDGDNSAFPAAPPSVAAGPPGSGAIEAIFHHYFASQGLASSETPFNGRSDYGPWIAKGVPAGGLFTGAEGVKTAAEAATYGGTAGAAYDPCYHLGCDTIDNVNQTALSQMSDAIAHTSLTLAKQNFGKSPLANPAPASGTGGTGGGGGLHDDHPDESS